MRRIPPLNAFSENPALELNIRAVSGKRYLPTPAVWRQGWFCAVLASFLAKFSPAQMARLDMLKAEVLSFSQSTPSTQLSTRWGEPRFLFLSFT